MTHKPIQLHHLSLSFPHKQCFTDFSQQILAGDRIAIIGRNGSGKSTLLQLIQGNKEPTDGDLILPTPLCIGYVPQIIEDEVSTLSGGQRFNAALTKALYGQPDVLLLDEPTNHLDRHYRRSLMKLLYSFSGTLIIVTHDAELIRNTLSIIWHIDHGQVTVFSGNYDDYMQTRFQQQETIAHELAILERQKKDMHSALMKEQQRAKHSRQRGEKHIQQRKWPTIVSAAKARNAAETSGHKKSAIKQKKNQLLERLADYQSPEIIKPNFKLTSTIGQQTLVSITQGSIGYPNQPQLLEHIRFSLRGTERIAINGDNGSGKSTLLKAILGDASVVIQGEWILPKKTDIGYLDQHYNTLPLDQTVIEVMSSIMHESSYLEIRTHLNHFLFRKNEEVEACIATLSGGERARLSLAYIAAISPKLLILDEVTNNLDQEAREHVIQVLQAYPGAMIIVSHDHAFLSAIGITETYQILNHTLMSELANQ